MQKNAPPDPCNQSPLETSRWDPSPQLQQRCWCCGELLRCQQCQQHERGGCDAVQKNQRARGIDSQMQEEYVGIVDTGGMPMGVIHLVGSTERQKALGPLAYSAKELAAVTELGKHVGAFLDKEPLRSQIASR